ncbi:hypothetical protein [Virgibacillus sediminis]|uniref:Head-to-tail stopper n=1 Tax=Virgibacillus sediminis TaxID=202260 RepID=A0ABV7A6J1_9BACI
MTIFDFSTVFGEFSRPFQHIPYSESYRDYTNGGQWVKGAELPPVNMEGVILPLGNDDLQFDTAGTYTIQDRKLFLQEPETLEEEAVVEVDGLRYRVTGDKPYGHYAGFNVYFLKRTDIGGETS